MAVYPCTDDPSEVLDKMIEAEDNADKFDKFVNGGVTEYVQLGSGLQTPVIRNVVRLMKSAAAEIDGSDISGKFSTSNGGTTIRMLDEHFGDILNVRDFGAVGDGTTPDNDAIQDMIDTVGYALFLHGVYACGTDTFDAPLVFFAGASLYAPSGTTVTITGRIDAPRRQIFTGQGSYLLGNDADSGEDARMVHASWFGCVPTSATQDSTTADALQKAVDSLGLLREGIVELDVGRYFINKTITVNRGIWIKGSSIRRTIFYTNQDGWPIFKTNGTACRFTGIQAECDGTSITKRTSPFIQLNNDWCRVQEIEASSQLAVVVNGINCTVEDVWAVSGQNLGEGTSLIEINAFGATVRNVYAFQSAYGPENMVSIKASSSTVREILVENIYNMMPARSVALLASGTFSISNTIIRNIRSTPYSSIDTAIYLGNTGTGTVSSVMIDGAVVFSNVNDVACINQNNASGTIKNITFNNMSNNGRAYGVALKNQNGTMDNIVFGDSVDLRSATTPVSIVGNVTNVSIPPHSLINTAPAMSTDIDIDDNDVHIIDPGKKLLSALLVVSSFGAYYGMYFIRTNSDIHMITPVQESPEFEHAAAGTALSGSTGTDGKVTVSVANSKIYIENRLGSTGRFSYMIASGAL